MMLGGYAGDGDWRILFQTRDDIKKVTAADVARVAAAYLKSSNRTLGEFIPTKVPDRSVIPDTPDPAARLKDYKGGEAVSAGEAFDPTPANIEARAIRRTLPNGLKLVMFPKKTRGGTVVAILNVRFGDEKSLFGKSAVGQMTGALLMRGTKNKTRQQIQDETDRLKAQINVSGGVTGGKRQRPHAGGEPRRFPAFYVRVAARAVLPRNRIRADPAAAPCRSRKRQKRTERLGLARPEPPYGRTLSARRRAV
ncbi:MAG: hypothetical protein WDO73_08775 [Ignavibacteriota bacterium]